MHSDDVRMRQGAEDARLAQEAFAQRAVVLQPGIEDLQRDVAFEAVLYGEVHGGHAAMAQLAHDAVAVGFHLAAFPAGPAGAGSALA